MRGEDVWEAMQAELAINLAAIQARQQNLPLRGGGDRNPSGHRAPADSRPHPSWHEAPEDLVEAPSSEELDNNIIYDYNQVQIDGAVHYGAR